MARINIEIGNREVDLDFPIDEGFLGADVDELSHQLFLAFISLKVDPKTIAKRLIAESEATYGEATS